MRRQPGGGRIVLLAGVLVAGGLQRSAGIVSAEETAGAANGPAGALAVTRGAADLIVPPSAPNDRDVRYGLGIPFQVGPRTAGLLCNLRFEGRPVADFENGADLILFDDLAHIRSEGAVPITRSEWTTDPQTGAARVLVRYPVLGGFVPLGAKRSDGTPHPHAGTGFGVCNVLRFPADAAGNFSWEAPAETSIEILQFLYDGKTFRVTRTDRRTVEDPLRVSEGGWTVWANSITMAIPDGDDLLLADLGQSAQLVGWHPDRPNDSNFGACGLTRWRRQDGLWQPASFVPVTDTSRHWIEPSLVRDRDGALLFTARGHADAIESICIWRSADGGATWQQVVNATGKRHPGPTSIDRAADGTPFVAGNPKGHRREVLFIWPLDALRSGLEEPIVVRDAPAEFGPAPDKRGPYDPPYGGWCVDHASGAVVRLADGKWHSILGYRVLDYDEMRGAYAQPQAGCYVEEVITRGPPNPAWNLD
jgi:hypothetical protein